MPRPRKPPAVAPPATARASAPAAASEMMDTREVAAYLRLKERRVYDLARSNVLPHLRATGKLLFPRAQIDAWLAAKSGSPLAPATVTPSPPIVAGSHDPLLEWAARESASGLAVLACGSSAGLDRLVRRDAMVAAMHWLDRATGEYNVPLVRKHLAADAVVVEWARRSQGLLLAPGNPMKIRKLPDLARKGARMIGRQPEAGSQQLLLHLLANAGIAPGDLAWNARPALAETDLAAAIREGHADAGVAIEAAARAHGLAFIPLTVERLDLVVRHRDYFEPPVQALLAFARSPEFAAHANAMGGYEVGGTGRVVFNG